MPMLFETMQNQPFRIPDQFEKNFGNFWVLADNFAGKSKVHVFDNVTTGKVCNYISWFASRVN